MPLLPTRRRRKRAAEGRTPRSRPKAEPAAERRRPPIVELRDATVVYPGGHVALERVSFGIQRGEFVFVVGPTGCGKSTLIRTLTGEVKAASGHVLIAGRDIDRLPKRRIPHLRRRIGTVFQDFKLLPNRTVYDNVAYTLKVTGASRGDVRRKVPEILRLVGLQGKVHNYPDQLSGGEQQRVSIARAFVNHPPLLLADEPTGNLDPETSIGIMQLLYRINRTGTTVLVVTHDRDMVDKMRRRVLALDEGRLVRDQVTATYDEESTSEFGVRVRSEMGVGEGHTNGERAPDGESVRNLPRRPPGAGAAGSEPAASPPRI
jgi:cell division transport system ATP-binding protein